MLTVKKVETLRPGMHCDGDGLYLQVRPNGRSWIFRYTPPGGVKQRHMGLGSTRFVTLAEARDRVHTLNRQVKIERVDPLVTQHAAQAERVQAREQEHPRVPTFAECAKACLIERQEGLAAKYRQQSAAQLEQFAFPVFGSKRVNAVTREHVLQVLQPIWSTAHPTARRVQKLLSMVFRYAIFKEWRDNDPAQWKDALDNVLARPEAVHDVKHREALDVGAAPAFMAKLRAAESVYHRATEFTILTVARKDMTRRAVWAEIDMAARVWTIPKGKMKTRRDFRLPLVGRAWEIIELMAKERRNDHVFPGSGSKTIRDGAQLHVVKAISTDATLTIHGMRTTFRTWAQGLKGLDGRLYFDRETIETAMAHKVHGSTEAAYARGDLLDERRKLMQAWDDYCSR